MKRLFAAVFFLASVSFLAGNFYYRLDSVTAGPNVPKKAKGLVIENNVYKYESKLVKLEIEPLLLKDIGGYYKGKGLVNPFEEVPEAFNYIFFRIRIENLSKETPLDFSPSSAIMNDCLPKDDTSIYQLFYEKADGEKKLDAAGKTIFMTPLTLPPKMWIERLMFFEYDEFLPTKKVNLLLTNITVGREIFEAEFPFRTKFVKETKE